MRDPLEPAIARAEVELRDCALATSASYANSQSFNAAGVVLDPHANTEVGVGCSASVRAGSCAVADALAKCVLLLGESSARLLRRFQADGFLIKDSMQTVIDTEGDDTGSMDGVHPAYAARDDTSRVDPALANRQSDAMLGNPAGASS